MMRGILTLLENKPLLDCAVVIYRDHKGLWHTIISERGNKNDLPVEVNGVTLAGYASKIGDSIDRCNQLAQDALKLEID